MNAKLKKAIINSALVAGAMLIAGLIVTALIFSDRVFKKRALERDAQAVRDAELTILEAEERLSNGRSVEPIIERLAGMDESLLSNSQLRRRLLALGDSYMLLSKRSERPREKELYNDLAVKSFERAAEFAKGPGLEAERCEIARRMAEMYFAAKDYAKALQVIEAAKDVRSLPSDRWLFKMIEAECLLKSGRPYGAVAAFSTVADESEDKAIWGEATVRRGQTYLEIAANPKSLALFMDKDSSAGKTPPTPVAMEEERKRLLVAAMHDFEKVVTDLGSYEKSNGAAKLGMLRIAAMRRDKKAAYEIVNSIQASPMSMRDKAESLVILARLHERFGEYKKAISVLETCAQSYPLSAMFVPVSLDLYEYYKKAGKWEKAFSIAERLIMRGPDAETVERIINEFSPENSDMLELIGSSVDKDKYIERLQSMLDKIKSNRPETWKLVQNKANLILCTILYIAGKYQNAEKAIAGSLAVPLIPKPIEDELLHLDLECAIKRGDVPAVVVVRARRYLHEFPVGKYYQDALASMLDAYFNMELYDSALEVAKRLYMDDLMKRNSNGKPGKYWIETVARIGECYAKTGNLEKANTILRDNAKAILASEDPYNAFRIWAGLAAERGQYFEAMRRLDIALPYVKTPVEIARLLVARYLLQLKVGGNKDFEATKALLAKIEGSDKLDFQLKDDLRRKLWEGLLEYVFRSRPDMVNSTLGQALRQFKGEAWLEYWILLSLSRMLSDDSLASVASKYKKAMAEDSAFFKSSEGESTVKFIDRQLGLISKLLDIDEKAQKLRKERNL